MNEPLNYKIKYPTLTINIQTAYELSNKRYGFYRLATAYKLNGMVMQLKISEEKDENMNYRLKEPVLIISPEHASNIALYEINNELYYDLNINEKEIKAKVIVDASIWRDDEE